MDRRGFDVRSDSWDGGVTVVARGDVDLATSPVLREALVGAVADTLVLDLRSVDFMDSSGLGVLVGQNKRARENHTRFAVAVADASPVRRILELSGLAGALELVSDPLELTR